MVGALKAAVTTEFVNDISRKLDEAAGIARAASSLGTQGFSDRAFRTLLDIEPLITDATTLLNATSIICRHQVADAPSEAALNVANDPRS